VGRGVGTDNLEAARPGRFDSARRQALQVPDLVAEIRPALTASKTIVSFAARKTDRSKKRQAGHAVIRAMPNTPSALGAGAAGLWPRALRLREQMELAKRVFDTVGRRHRGREAHGRRHRPLGLGTQRTFTSCIEALVKRA